MYQRCFQCVVFILTIVAGTQTTALVNASADWFVDNYIEDSLIEPVSESSLSQNCEPLVLVLTSDGELYVGKDKLGRFDSDLERFEEPAALFIGPSLRPNPEATGRLFKSRSSLRYQALINDLGWDWLSSQTAGPQDRGH
ncbi:MAG: hypothetical protein ACRD8U_08130 [Pyrinomonadaceae bacterium]